MMMTYHSQAGLELGKCKDSLFMISKKKMTIFSIHCNDHGSVLVDVGSHPDASLHAIPLHRIL
jgi:hypothetical protein